MYNLTAIHIQVCITQSFLDGVSTHQTKRNKYIEKNISMQHNGSSIVEFRLIFRSRREIKAILLFKPLCLCAQGDAQRGSGKLHNGQEEEKINPHVLVHTRKTKSTFGKSRRRGGGSHKMRRRAAAHPPRPNATLKSYEKCL